MGSSPPALGLLGQQHVKHMSCSVVVVVHPASSKAKGHGSGALFTMPARILVAHRVQSSAMEAFERPEECVSSEVMHSHRM